MDLVFYVSAIKIDVNGLCASQAEYILTHHVKMQINKNTTTSYASQRERDGGMISQGIGRREYSNPWSNGENPNVKGENP